MPDLQVTGPEPQLIVLLGLPWLWSIVLLALGTVLAAAVGRTLLRPWMPEESNATERAVFWLATGWGTLGLSAFGLGLLGLLNPTAALALLAGFALACHRSLAAITRSSLRLLLGMPRGLASTALAAQAAMAPMAPGFRWLTLTLGGVIVVAVFLNALLPATDFDALVYHLAGPRFHIMAGRFFDIPESPGTSFPFLVEAVYTLGLLLGADVLSQLLQFSFAVALAAAIYAFGVRYLSRRAAVFAVILLVSTPTIGGLATIPQVEMARALLEFLALYALFLWWEQRRPQWLVIGGLLCGFALGIKYLALVTWALLAGFVFLSSFAKGRSIASALGQSLGFALIAAVVGSPWYLKNLVVHGNPVYPFGHFGPEDVGRLDPRLGAGAGLVDFLLLPIRIYVEHWRFGHLLWGFPHPLALALPALLWLERRPAENILLALAGAWFVVWALGAQDLRYLIFIYPLVCLLGGSLLDRLLGPRMVGRLAATSILLSVLVLSAAIHPARLIYIQAGDYLVGREATEDYLARLSAIFVASRYVNRELEPGGRMLFVSEGRTYYLPRPVPHDIQELPGQLRRQFGSPTLAADVLRASGVKFLVVNWDSYLEWGVARRGDPSRFEDARFLQDLTDGLDAALDLGSIKIYRL